MTKASGRAVRRDRTLTQEAPGKAGRGRARTSPTSVLAERDWTNPQGVGIHFVLLERLNDSSPPWQSLKLVASAAARLKKYNWYLGWNGSRLARNHGGEVLAQHYPEIYNWVLAKLRAQGE